MATPDHYVDSNAAGANDGTSWTDAYTSIDSIEGSSGDAIIWVAHNHSETVTGLLDGTANTAARDAPMTIVSINSGTDLYQRGAAITLSGAIGTTADTGAFFYGFEFNHPADLDIQADSFLKFFDCGFTYTGTSSSVEVQLDNQDMADNDFFFNCDFDWGNTAETFIFGNSGWSGNFYAKNCYVDGDGSVLSAAGSNGRAILLESMDFSDMPSGMDLVDNCSSSTAEAITHRLYNIIMPASYDWPGATINSKRENFLGINVGSGNTTHGIECACYSGTVVDSTATYLNGDVDGTSISLQFDTNANAVTKHPVRFMICEFWASANPTITVNLTSDVVLTDAVAWLEIEAAKSGEAQGMTFASTQTWGWADGSTPANLTTNTESWTNASTNRYEISHTVTGGAEGMHRVWFCLGYEGAATVYVDPEPEIS